MAATTAIWASCCTGWATGLAECGIDLFLAAIPEDRDELAVIRNIVDTRRADGLILARTLEADPRVDFLIGAGFPFVTHGRISHDDAPVWWLDTDGAAAFAEAFDMLHGLGHRRFGLVTMEEQTTFRMHRTEGLLARHRPPPRPRGQPGRGRRRRGSTTPARHRAARDLLTRPERPTAVLCLFDGFALDLLYEARGWALGAGRSVGDRLMTTSPRPPAPG